MRRAEVILGLRGQAVMAALLGWVGTLTLTTASADVTLAPVFGDHMVLQSDLPLPIWGTAAPGERVTVSLDGEVRTTAADQDGLWSVTLRARPAGAQPLSLTVAGNNTLVLTNIVVGEVWLCSGQSNMHWPLKQDARSAESLDAADLPLLRLLNLQGNPYPNGREFTEHDLANCEPDKYLRGCWAVSSSESAAEFSAVATYFGRELLKVRQTPVGLIHNAIGGTPTESWIPRDAMVGNPALQPLCSHWIHNELVNSFCRERARRNLGSLAHAHELLDAQLRHPYQPGFMYEAGIAPLAPYAIRGVVWYQGESNVHDALLHDVLFSELVTAWRQAWGRNDFPFLYVQLPNLAGGAKWPEFRESQRRGLRIPNTAMAVTIDIGDPADVHPPDKREVGLRLALLARNLAYSEKIVASGPTLDVVQKEGTSIRIVFKPSNSELKARDDGDLRGFEVAGSDGAFVPAEATIQENEVRVRSSSVPNPIAVRYGFAPNPDCNLINRANLPASPFLSSVN